MKKVQISVSEEILVLHIVIQLNSDKQLIKTGLMC